MFLNRIDAAKRLLPHLKKYEGLDDTLLLAIPRGALEIGAYLRDELHLPLDIVMTKKIGAPGNEEYAIGAVDPDGNVYLNEEAWIPPHYIEKKAEELKKIIVWRMESYRGKRPFPDIEGKTLIIVDDGIATGLTTIAACRYLRAKGPAKIILAVPVGAPDSIRKLEKEVDALICLDLPEEFYAVGAFYQDFPQVSDEEAIRLLRLKTQH